MLEATELVIFPMIVFLGISRQLTSIKTNEAFNESLIKKVTFEQRPEGSGEPAVWTDGRRAF
jgi:hypothetical protein